jgi:hypothetical protein
MLESEQNVPVQYFCLYSKTFFLFLQFTEYGTYASKENYSLEN